MATLYILHKSPYFSPEMKDALTLVVGGDGIVLTQDSVFGLRSEPERSSVEKASERNIEIFALKVDLEARSVKPLPCVKTIDYADLIDLLNHYESTFS